MTARKIDAMHKRYGTYPSTCKGCDHCITGMYHNRRYSKCELYGITRSDATDWRQSYMACGMYNRVPEHYDTYQPIIEQIKHESRKNGDGPIAGQVQFKI